jgi:hypothetical protein
VDRRDVLRRLGHPRLLLCEHCGLYVEVLKLAWELSKVDRIRVDNASQVCASCVALIDDANRRWRSDQLRAALLSSARARESLEAVQSMGRPSSRAYREACQQLEDELRAEGWKL